jgi:iron complex transport system permease protein
MRAAALRRRALPAPLRRPHPGWLVAALALAAAALSVRGLYVRLPPALWWSAVLGADGSDAAVWAVHYGVLPRIAVSILAGAMLALAATIFQQVLRNPLAEPATLGVSAGAALAATITALWLPDLSGFGREGAAFAGAGLATLAVIGLAWGAGLAPLALILAGLIVGLCLGAISAMAALFHHQELQSVFLWSSGMLRQNSWSAAGDLLLRLVIGLLLAMLLVRPLVLLGLDEESGRSLGLPRRGARLAALVLAVALSACVVSTIGVIGFIGLAAPAIARLAGARTVHRQLLWAPLVGGTLLWPADQLVQILPFVQELPTGVGTAVLGAPLLLWMLPRLKSAALPPRTDTAEAMARSRRPWVLVLAGLVLLAALLMPALYFSRGTDGWTWLSGEETWRLLRWRWPRTGAAAAAGAMLAVAGVLLQRLTANPLASPEVLGISSGAAAGVIALAFLVATPAPPAQVAAAAIGALAALIAMVGVGRRAAFAPERLLLAGIAVSTAFGALVAILLASGDPRMGMLLSWMAGSTYRVGAPEALVALALTSALLPLMPLFARWLEILPLGEASSRALGLGPGMSRFRLLLAAAVLTGAATLVVGPLSFVGLMAPHMARMMGLQRPMAQLYGSALLGALIMVTADWLGRNLLFPYQIPAGLLATLVGGPYFMWQMGRGGRRRG